MADIDNHLEAVGNDSINNLFDFVKAWYEAAKEHGDTIDQFVAERTVLEVSEAIYLYSRWKEMKCQESEN